MENKEPRWQQRLANFKKALAKLTESVTYIRGQEEGKADDKNRDDMVWQEMMKEGLIQRFEYTHELAWNVMKDYALYQGNSDIAGSRDATREAFQMQLIAEGHI